MRVFSACTASCKDFKASATVKDWLLDIGVLRSVVFVRDDLVTPARLVPARPALDHS